MHRTQTYLLAGLLSVAMPVFAGEPQPPLRTQDRALERLEMRIEPNGGSYAAQRQSLDADLERERFRAGVGGRREAEFRRRRDQLERGLERLPRDGSPRVLSDQPSGRTRLLDIAIPETGLTLEDLEGPE